MKTIILAGLMTLTTSAFANEQCDYKIDQIVVKTKSHIGTAISIDASEGFDAERKAEMRAANDKNLSDAVAAAKAECTPH